MTDDLRAQGCFWAQQARVALWHRLTALTPIADPVREAWAAGKYLLDALRFHGLLAGRDDTRSASVVAGARTDARLTEMSWVGELPHLLAVAREQIPPPSSGIGPATRYLLAALEGVDFVAAGL
jgi:hypothetical protein